VLSGFGVGVYGTTFSPDGTRILAKLEDNSVRIWNAVDGEQIAIMRHKFVVHSAAFSPDGMRVLTTSLSGSTVKEADADYAAHIWDAANGEEVGSLRGHTRDIWSVAFSPDGMHIVTASWDKTARVWDAATGTQIAVLQHEGNVNSASYSRDGMRIVTASGKTARVWDAATGMQIAVLQKEHEMESAIFNPDRTLVLTALRGGAAHVWNLSTGQEVSVLGSPLSAVEAVQFSDDGGRVLAILNFIHAARIWQHLPALPAKIAPLVILDRSSGVGSATSASFSPDGARVIAGSAQGVRIWNASNGKEITVLPHKGSILSASFSRDGKMILTISEWCKRDFDYLMCSHDRLRVWDAASGELKRVIASPSRILSAIVSADGMRVFTVSRDQGVEIWDIATGKEVATPIQGRERFRVAALSADGRHLVTSGEKDRTAHVFDVTTGKEIAVLRGHEANLTYVGFSPDGTRIATASGAEDPTARIWDTVTGKKLVVLQGHEGGLNAVAFNADGTRVVTGARDGTARVWDVASGKEITAPLLHEHSVESAAFGGDGRRIVTTTWMGVTRIWAMP